MTLKIMIIEKEKEDDTDDVDEEIEVSNNLIKQIL